MPANTNESNDLVRTTSGRKIFWGNIAAFGLLIGILIASRPLLSNTGNINQKILYWQDRDSWPQLAVKATASTMEYNMLVAAETGQSHPTSKIFILNDDPAKAEQIEKVLKQCARLAGQDSFFSDQTLEQLLSLKDITPDSFYPLWLIGAWYHENDKTTLAHKYWDQAWPKAEHVLCINQASIDKPFALAIDRITEDGESIDSSLALVYPAMRSNASNCHLVPCYKAAFRFVDVSKAGLNQPGTQWFAFPSVYGELQLPAPAELPLQPEQQPL